MLLISSPTYLIFFLFPCHCSCRRVKFLRVEAGEMCCQSNVDTISFATCTYTCIVHHIAIRDLCCCVPDHRMVTSLCVFHRRFVVRVLKRRLRPNFGAVHSYFLLYNSTRQRYGTCCAQILQLCARIFSCIILRDRVTAHDAPKFCCCAPVFSPV